MVVCVHVSMCESRVVDGEEGGGLDEGEVRKVYSGRLFCFCHIPVKLQQGGQEHMAKCFPSWLR